MGGMKYKLNGIIVDDSRWYGHTNRVCVLERQTRMRSKRPLKFFYRNGSAQKAGYGYSPFSVIILYSTCVQSAQPRDSSVGQGRRSIFFFPLLVYSHATADGKSELCRLARTL